MAPSQKPSKSKIKQSKSRLASTTAISQPVVEDSSLLTSLSAFSRDGLLFAYLALAVDKHRLRVYNTTTNQMVAEHAVDVARVSTLSWATVNLTSESQNSTQDNDSASPSKKKRRKRTSTAAGGVESPLGSEFVVLGLSDGTIVFFSPTQSRVVRTLSHPSSSTPILSVTPSAGTAPSLVWSSSADGSVLCWDAQKGDLLDSWKTDDRIPYTYLTVRPNDEEGRADLLAAHHSIRLLSKSTNSDAISKKAIQLASFTGHSSSIKLMKWVDTRTVPERFATLAEGDRFMYLWHVNDGATIEGKAVASVPLDSDARIFSISSTSNSKQCILAALSASGKVSIYPIPEELNPPASTARTSHKIPTLLARSNISASSKNSASSSPIIDVAFPRGDSSSIQIARLAKGVRPVFTTLKYLDEGGNYVASITLDEVDLAAASPSTGAPAAHRYAESSAAVIGAGTGIGLNEADDDVAMREIDGDLEVDLAELSLGQRLTAVNEGEPRPDSDSDEPANGALDKSSKKRQKSQSATENHNVNIVPANSLTRTLIQALHSSDSRLLETCLRHSDPVLIQSTVRRLPPQLAIPLITACTERLGRGGRAGNMKGGGGGASAQRGNGLIIWAKTVLAVHSGHLMTIPDLVARLSGLYATITARLALHESLLELNGKLDMVLSQVEMRSSAAPAPLAVKKRKGRKGEAQKIVVKRYVEGESDSSEAEEDGDIEVESGEDEGSVEDVELGGDSSDGSEGDEDGSDEDDEDGSDNDSMGGFIDDEAEEWSEEDEDDEEFSE